MFRPFQKINKILLTAKFETGYYTNKEFSSKLRYRLHVPKIKRNMLYPLIVYLHSGTERGENNRSQINSSIGFWVNYLVQKNHQCFVLAPQCPETRQWVNTHFISTPFDHYKQDDIPESDEVKKIIKLIDKLLIEYPIDINRLYITGFSMGASGTWDIITRYPDKFAAAVPISGVSDTTKAYKITHVSIWAFHGEDDNIAPARLNVKMIDSIKASGGFPIITIFKGVGHNCCKQVYNNPDLKEWLFSQSRKYPMFSTVI